MSAREWKPGDVAMVTVDYGNDKGPRDVVCFRTPGWWRDSTNGNSYGSALREVKAARPLVVIDPEDREQVERLIVAYSSQPRWHTGYTRDRVDAMQAALREFANPKPPKPEEPTGLGAVVEDGYDKPWVRVNSKTGWWWRNDRGVMLRWADLSAVRVLSEGVTA